MISSQAVCVACWWCRRWLRNNELTGTLPTELGLLTSLENMCVQALDNRFYAPRGTAVVGSWILSCGSITGLKSETALGKLFCMETSLSC